jgi:hypothetical protein
MKQLRYLIFLIFNLAYQDGNNEKNDPDFYSIMFMIFFEFFLLIVGLAFLNKFVDFDVFSDVKPSRGAKLIFGFIFFAQLYLPNHYFFIKKKYFDRIYNEFKDAEMNTRKNRKIGYTCLILYFPIMLVVIFNLKRWLSL